MARTKQTARRGSRAVWRHKNFIDHSGDQATLWSLVEELPRPDEPPLPPFAFQVYSTIPLSNHLKLLEYLSSQIDFRPGPSFEIYAPKPDAFACVEHQRREIAHRKISRRQGNGAEFMEDQFPYLPGIAKVRDSMYVSDRVPQGFLLVITSDSYQCGWSNAPEYESGTGPLWVTFNRKFPSKTRVDRRYRVTLIPEPDVLETARFEEVEAIPEANELSIQRCQSTWHMKHSLRWIFPSEGYDYGLDEDEGQPLEEVDSLLASCTPGDYTRKFPSDRFVVSRGPEGAITVTSLSTVAEPDFRYIVHVPFLCYSEEGYDGLEAVARAFTSAIMPYLPDGKTLQLAFYKPPSPSYNSIIDSHRDILRSRPEMSIGTLCEDYPPNWTRKCLFYKDPEIPLAAQGRIEPYKVFAVVLDKPDFINESGVLFLMTDGGFWLDDPIVSPTNPEYVQYSDYYETKIWRSAGMPEVAKRLGMPAFEMRYERPALCIVPPCLDAIDGRSSKL